MSLRCVEAFGMVVAIEAKLVNLAPECADHDLGFLDRANPRWLYGQAHVGLHDGQSRRKAVPFRVWPGFVTVQLTATMTP